MYILNAVELVDGTTGLDVVDASTTLVSRYVVATGNVANFMRELRRK